MSTVRLHHPDLPREQEIEVDACSVPHYRATGWQNVDPLTPPQPPSEAEKSAEPDPPAASKRRGAAKKESD